MMSDEHAHSRGELVEGADGETGGPDANASQLELFEQVIQIERQRIESQNSRTEVALRAVEASDASDKRQYEFHKQKLESDERMQKARLVLGSRIALGVGAILAVFVLAVLYMAFFGTETQAKRALELLVWAFTALGGGGLLLAGQRSIQWLMKR